jgi:hypothetical protein
MPSCFNPKHLTVAAFLLVATTLRGLAAEGDQAPAASATTSLSVTDVNFSSPLQDPLARGTWMVAEVEFAPKVAGSKWLDGVDVTLTIGWGKTGSRAEIDLALTSSIHLLAVENDKRYAVFFFVPPEVLAHDGKNPFAANTPPTFYAVQFKAGGNSLSDEYRKSDVSYESLPSKEYVDAFVAKGQKGELLSEAEVPSYVLMAVVSGSRIGSNVLPTFVQNTDSGH